MKEKREDLCKRNVQAWMKWKQCPPVEVTEAFADHCLLAYSPAFATWCEDHLETREIGITLHQPKSIRSAVRGWQEPRGMCSAQIVLHATIVDGLFFEIDFDLFNPKWGLGVALFHGVGEALWHFFTGTKTNPRTVAKLLRKRGVEI